MIDERTLYREIGLIDEELILEAEAAGVESSGKACIRKKSVIKPLFIGGSACAAACLVLLLLGSLFLHEPEGKRLGVLEEESQTSGKEAENHTKEPEWNQDSLVFNQVSGVTEDKINIERHFWQELTEEEKKAVLPGIIEEEVSGTAHFQGDGSLFQIDFQVKMEGEMNVFGQIASGKPIRDYGFSTIPIESEVGGISVLGGYAEATRVNIYFVEFELGEAGYYLEFHVDRTDMKLAENAKEMFTELIVRIISGGEADFSILHPVIPLLKDEQLTLEEAYKDVDFGSYLPKQVPKGFTLESASRFINQESDYLYVLWTKGMDDLSVRISRLSEREKARITGAGENKNYDLSLYPIPRADSVPEELREIVDDPIFLIEELTREVVLARAYKTEDKGDGKGYRMRFGVLYEGDILVEINGKGVEPEFVFRQLTEIKKDIARE